MLNDIASLHEESYKHVIQNATVTHVGITIELHALTCLLLFNAIQFEVDCYGRFCDYFNIIMFF